MSESSFGDPDHPVTPTRLADRDELKFACHAGVACWNLCCHGADVTLTPGDILRLTHRLNLSAPAFLAAHTVPAVWDRAGLPVAKLRMAGTDGEGACGFVSEAGCMIYGDRPLTCRTYPLGQVAVRAKDTEVTERFHCLVAEPQCLGHRESKVQTVAEFRAEQGVDDYQSVNCGWVDILMKMASWRSVGGPGGREVSAQAKQMFYMVSTDAAAFRRFVFETRFLDSYDIDTALVPQLRTDDALLLNLGFDWLKGVLFNDPILAVKETVLREAMADMRAELGGA
ncbi:MAG: YkgJ family cysteine cluster protein [Alphaproteobacteria bacterium]|jgi:hypothetical protein|nr:YkgJ family cysteine cluster protein [Alphaproteobacteria bacterium]MDP6515748.1 YkgJ family cysteine cluster protein [Alphaproteobacteria bacterium]